jgi:N-acetylmuramoyl-L-alanine amidase
MIIKQNLCDQRNYRKTRRGNGKIEYIVIHYTGNVGDTDEGNANYFAGRDTGDTSAHYFVDEDSVTQSVPDNSCAFHCGGTTYKHPKCRNDNSIGIEMCSDKDANGKFIITGKTVNNTVELTKMKMKQYGLELDKVLRHFDITGKKCPEPWVRDENQWNDFKARLINDNNIKEDIEFNTCVDQLIKDNVMTKPTTDKNYWKESIKNNTDVNGEWVGTIIKKMVSGKITNVTLEKAVNYLVDQNIIVSPNYWITNAVKNKTCRASYVRNLFVDTVKILKL